MFRYFWALPAILRLAICDSPTFSVHNDLLAFPQYEVIYSSSYISITEAEALLAQPKVPVHATTSEDIPVVDTADLSLHRTSHHDSPQAEIPESVPRDASRDTHERLLLHGRPYLCTIPYVEPPLANAKNTTNTTTTAEEVAQEEVRAKAELTRATEHGLELLSAMQGQCIYYSSGWWVYSFCYNEAIKQFHPLPPGRNGAPIFPPVEDRNVGSYLLGKFPGHGKNREEVKPAEGQQGAESIQGNTKNTDVGAPESLLQTTGANNYLVQRLAGGTPCDLTGNDRRIELQFHCNPGSQDRISMIKETASCVYLMVIQTPRLCNDVAFLPPQHDKPHAISCREIIGSAAEEANWRRRKQEEVLAALSSGGGLAFQGDISGQQVDPTQAQAQQAQKPLVIGGITVGAREHVGSTPENTITPSNIIGATSPQKQTQAHPGGPEKFIATLARSDGKYVSIITEEELKKLGLKGTADELSNWVKQMESQAGVGTPWRLDVVVTGEGIFEFRGILLPKIAGEKKGQGKEVKATKKGQVKQQVAEQRQATNQAQVPLGGGDAADEQDDADYEYDDYEEIVDEQPLAREAEDDGTADDGQDDEEGSYEEYT